MDAILEATTQGLLSTGKERLTTTRGAERAGVSIGTLYQYFPNKNALLQAVLKRHFDEVAEAVEKVSQEQRGSSLARMAEALVTAFLCAKMRNPRISVALYSISSDVDGLRLASQLSARLHSAMTAMLQSAPETSLAHPDLVATLIQGAMAGVSRRLLESDHPEANFEPYRRELVAMMQAYLARSGAATAS